MTTYQSLAQDDDLHFPDIDSAECTSCGWCVTDVVPSTARAALLRHIKDVHDAPRKVLK